MLQIFSDAYDTYLHFSTIQGRQDINDARTDVIVDPLSLNINKVALLDTTAGNMTSTGILIVNEDSVAEGGNQLTNRGLYITVNNGDFNYAAIFANGSVGVNVNDPTARLHLAAQTNAAGSAPLKFTASVDLIPTPEDGAMEFDGTNLYITIGGVRRTITVT